MKSQGRPAVYHSLTYEELGEYVGAKALIPIKKNWLENLGFDFGEVSVGAKGEKTVQVTNSGNAAVTIGQINTGNGVFTASVSSKSLAPGETSSLLLRFSPVNGTNYASTAQVYSNAENSPTRLSLRGMGVASPRFAFNPDNLSITVAAGQH